MAGFDEDFRFAEIVHSQILGPLYAALGHGTITIERLDYDQSLPYRGDVIIKRPGYADLYIEEKASRPRPHGKGHDYFLLELDAPGEPSLRSLKYNDVIVFAQCHSFYVDVYFLRAKALSDWVFGNSRQCSVRRLFFQGGRDVIVVMIPIALVVRDLGTGVRLYRVILGCRTGGVIRVGGRGG
jgi:hypothetical protein